MAGGALLFLIFLASFGSLACAKQDCGAGSTCEALEQRSQSQMQDGQSLLQTHSVDTTLSKKAAPGACSITDTWITIGNKKYSRYEASRGNLGRWGSSSGGNPTKVNFMNNGESAWTSENILFATNVSITSDQVHSITASAGFKVQPASASASIHNNGSYNADMQLMVLTFKNQNEIPIWMNKNPASDTVWGIRNVDDARISTTVVVLVSGQPEVSTACTGGSFSMSVDPYGNAGISGSNCGSNVWSYSQNSVVAYEASSFPYDKDENEWKPLVNDPHT